MQLLSVVGLLMVSYLIGAIPSGMIIVKLSTGKDVRQVESGRTGGTNVMRAAGFWAGLATALLDVLKSAVAVWLARAIFPLSLSPWYAWVHVLAPIAAILGHNYSVFLIRRDIKGRIRLGGGAGGAPCVGGSLGLWAPSVLIIMPIAAAILYFVGYASIATMSVALLSTLLFGILAIFGITPWQYALYGIISFIILSWSLRPNIYRLVKGQERLVGMRARGMKAVAKNS